MLDSLAAGRLGQGLGKEDDCGVDVETEKAGAPRVRGVRVPRGHSGRWFCRSGRGVDEEYPSLGELGLG